MKISKLKYEVLIIFLKVFGIKIFMYFYKVYNLIKTYSFIISLTCHNKNVKPLIHNFIVGFSIVLVIYSFF